MAYLTTVKYGVSRPSTLNELTVVICKALFSKQSNAKYLAAFILHANEPDTDDTTRRFDPPPLPHCKVTPISPLGLLLVGHSRVGSS